MGKAGDELGKDVAPPKTHEFPRPDPKVVPKPRQNRRRPGAIGNPKVTTPQKQLHQPDVGPGKSPGKANDKPGRNPQGKSARKPTDVSAEPQGGANEKPKVEQPKPQPKVEPKPKPKGESKDKP